MHVCAEGGNALERLGEVSGSGDLSERILNRAVLDPKTGRAARVIAGHHVDALSHELRHQKPGAELRQEGVRTAREGCRDGKIVSAPGVPAARDPSLAPRETGEQQSLRG